MGDALSAKQRSVIRCDHLIRGAQMVKCTKHRIRELKTALRWKIPAAQRQRIQMVLLREGAQTSDTRPPKRLVTFRLQHPQPWLRRGWGPYLLIAREDHQNFLGRLQEEDRLAHTHPDPRASCW